jgi:signal transduction histidine kinase/DNA-binding response OmpR family regulator
MNKFFRRLSLPTKLTLMALIPLALLVFFAIQIYREKTEKIGILENYLDRVDVSVNISSAIDELQSERRFSFGYLINQEGKTELILQRNRTDSALARLIRNPQLKFVETYTFLDSLGKIRIGIDNLILTPMDVMNYYTNTLFRLNTLNLVSAGNISYLNAVQGDLQGQKLLSEMITYFGLIRANIYYGLSSEQSSRQTQQGIRSIYDIYKSYEKEFLRKASPGAIQSYRIASSTTDYRPALLYVERFLRTGQYDSLYTSERWWDVSGNAIDELKKIQRNLLQQAQAGITAVYKQEKSARDKSLLFLILSIAAVIALISYTIAVIAKALGELNTAAEKIAVGETGLHIKVETDDAIGNLARSIIRIDNSNKTLASAADAIGSGNFEVDVKPRSKEDILGNAIVRMKEDLQQFSFENEEKLWISEGMEKISESLRGEKTLKEVAQDALDALTSYIGGQVGLLYVCYNDYLQFSAGYAIDNIHGVPSQISMGETLVGQSAQQRKLLQLKNLPPDFIKIKTGTGEAAPQNALLIPLVHNDSLEGVVEIASLEEFSPQTLSFISQVSSAIGIALQTAKSRARLQELLEQTQTQAEELQAQHSELENINAELEAQTEKLQASEEELKVQQEELVQANQELEERSRLLEERNQLIVERNMEIQQKARELEQSTKYKSEFLANMSHELRTPLNSVLLLSRLLAENNENNLTKEQVEYAEVIQTSGQGLLSLIDEILDLSKIEAGKMHLEYHPVLLNEIVNDMKALFTPVAREKKVDFVVRVDEQLPSQIETDKMRLEQVLKNLLSNALKFTSQGFVQMNISSLKENPSFICFSVKDTGIGIPKEKQALIFEAFQQADGSTRRKYGGTGLGLSISRELTKLLGGEIKVSSEAGKGSEFTIYLPISKHVVAPKPVAEAPVANEMQEPLPEPSKKGFRIETIPENLPDDRKAVAGNDKTILIIEDDTAFAKALLEYTHQKGYKGLVAVRGDEGIDLAKQYLPVGILLDIQLPVKDGWEVMEELKSDPATRHIPVHVMSSIEAKKESRMKGAVDFINKPIAFEQMQEVFKKIEEVLSKESKKVLIVEENPKHAKALAYFLETFEVATEISNTVDKGVDALGKDEVDCVILDMGIPDQHAYATLEEVKKKPGLEGLPIIIFTGKALSKTEEMRIKQYADSIVIKTAQSYQRILDEVSLFLHLVEENKQAEKAPSKYKRLGALNEVLSNKKILVTDDDVRNIFSLTKALEIHDMKVITAVDGKEALKQLEENPDTDVVLMDIMMPEMDGYEAMQKIRKKREFKNLPIIAVTAKAMSGDREKCIQAGASDYISKPVDIDQLLSLLRVWLYDKSM